MKQRWIVQIVLDEGAYDGADSLVNELEFLLDEQSEGEIQVVSVELDPDQEMPGSC